MTYADIMDRLNNPERMQRMGEIMSKFQEVVEVGDVVQMGVEGDEFCPQERPTAKVIGLGDFNDGHRSITVQFDDGTEQTLAGISNGHNWEFETETCFPKVVERMMRRQTEAPTFHEEEEEEDLTAIASSRPEHASENLVANMHEDVERLNKMIPAMFEVMVGLAEDLRQGSAKSANAEQFLHKVRNLVHEQ